MSTLADLYIRYSDLRHQKLTEAGQAENIDNAVKLLRERATQLGWPVGEVIIENDLTGEGKLKPASAYTRRSITLPSGEKIKRVIRPGFTRLVDRLKAGVSQAVIALDLDRTVRDPRDLEDLVDVCRAAGVNARSLSGSLTFTDGGTDAEITMARIMVAIAYKESADKARRQKVARRRKAEAGEWAGGSRPYGRGADGVSIHEPEAEIIRAACRRVLAGVSLRSQARTLNEQGHRTVAGREFTARDFRAVLLRPFNAGLWIYGGEVLGERPDHAIVPRDVWEAVRDTLTDPARRVTPGPGHVYLGTGLYFCWCGATVKPRLRRGKAPRRPAYGCGFAAQGGAGGRHAVRVMADVDEWVELNVVKRLARPDAAELIAPRPGSTVDVAALRAEVRMLRERKVTLARMFGEDGDVEALIAGKRSIDGKLARREELLRSATEVSPLRDLVGSGDVRAAWEKLTLGERRVVLRLLCRVEIWPLDGGDRTFDPTAVRIIWNA